jgi:hypothetical protein
MSWFSRFSTPGGALEDVLLDRLIRVEAREVPRTAAGTDGQTSRSRK